MEMKTSKRNLYAAVGVVVLLFAGLVYAWSVMSKSIAASRPGWNAAQVSLTFTLVMIFFCIGCLTAGFFAGKVNQKLYIVLAGILMFAGFFAASFTNDSILMLYLGFGVLCGLGAGVAYNAVMSTVSAWFPDKQGFISGVLLMGFGLSSFIVGKIYTAVTPSDGSDGWKMTFRMMGMITLTVMIICSFFFEKPGKEDQLPVSDRKKEAQRPDCDIGTSQMLKMPSFWFYYLWAILTSAAGLALVSQASGIAVQVGEGLNDGTIATVVGLISICNAVGRLIFGSLYDRRGYRFTMITDMIVFLLAGVLLFAALSLDSFFIIVLGFVVGGFAYGGVTPTNSAIISDFFGRRNYSMNFSAINTNLIIASFASAIAGKLYDSSGSYVSTCIMMIVVTLIAVFAFLGIRYPLEGHDK